MARIGILVTGYPGSGSTTLGKNIARELGWPLPYYSGGIVRWLAEKIEKQGRETFLSKTDEEIVLEISIALKSGEIPNRPSIAEEYKTFPPRLDLLVDSIQEKLIEDLDRGVHEGRLAWFFAKKLREEGRAADKLLISICCVVDPLVGAERQGKRPENSGKTIRQIFQETEERLSHERKRYFELYGITGHLARTNFDIVIDTTDLLQEGACALAFHEIDGRHPRLFSYASNISK